MQVVRQDDDGLDGERVAATRMPECITQPFNVIDQQRTAFVRDDREEVTGACLVKASVIGHGCLESWYPMGTLRFAHPTSFTTRAMDQNGMVAYRTDGVSIR